MKLEVFFAKDGDCLLLTSADGHHILVDGGRTASFESQTRPVLQDLADNGAPLDLVVVSHIDADHISGIIPLLQDVAAWEVHDFQVKEGNNPTFPEPKRPRPPEILGLWHNSWRAQLGDLAGPISAIATQVSEAIELAPRSDAESTGPARIALTSIVDLTESISDGIELMSLVDDQTPVPRNKGFRNKLVRLRKPIQRRHFGSLTLTVLGPTEEHLDDLRKEWRKWLEDLLGSGRQAGPRGDGQGSAGGPGLGLDGLLPAGPPTSRGEAEALISSISNAAEIIAESNAARVTPPNRASITVLAEEDGKTCLLTGDAAEDELLEGLAAAGRLAGGPFRCDILKVQHHGSENNLSTKFADQVHADHYVFCGDGAHGNPNPRVIATIVESRLKGPGRFTMWFNCSEDRTIASRREALAAAIKEAQDAESRHPDRIEVKVLDDTQPSFAVEL
ncbi:MBL fold metallo-hydrolase [Kribbella capetownensis]|uniref:MBL fold metallo-hydrolase n=1 Tax=Kribbella capetownensis TaxID=1572659 RepID=A0A4R0JRC0_9ACTN|nr:MBL fold metallo-hydrolase [Kribbella capetownensis]TCC49007.1 MBL fold metallo-hydrolase [Kribbella capetownensis]